LVVIIAIANRNTDPGPPQAAPVAKPAAKAPEAPALEVSAAQLYADYQANEVAADAKYKNKKLLVTGNVKEISKDAFGSPNLLLRTSNQFSSIMAGFSRANEGQLVSLAKGQKVTIRCLGGTMIIGSPTLKDCSVESE
jgi:hypothetical protein